MDREDRLCIVERELERLVEEGVATAQRIKALIGEVRKECAAMSYEHRRLASLYQTARELAETFELDRLLESIVDHAIALVDAADASYWVRMATITASALPLRANRSWRPGAR